MLVKYKQDYEKIALGLLSFTPDLKKFDRLAAELKNYTSDDQLALYLWRTEQGDFVGIVGIEIQSTYILLRHLAFTPDYRNQENAFAVLDALTQHYKGKRLMAPVNMTEIVSAWERHQGTAPAAPEKQ